MTSVWSSDATHVYDLMDLAAGVDLYLVRVGYQVRLGSRDARDTSGGRPLFGVQVPTPWWSMRVAVEVSRERYAGESSRSLVIRAGLPIGF